MDYFNSTRRPIIISFKHSNKINIVKEEVFLELKGVCLHEMKYVWNEWSSLKVYHSFLINSYNFNKDKSYNIGNIY